jgi:CRP/FNR family cyclic AMP-dependent transcriptional regulator
MHTADLGLSKTQHYQHLLQQDRWFAERPLDLQQELWQRAQLKPLHSKQRLFARGQAFDGIYAVLEGKMRIFGYQHKEALLAWVFPSQWFGEIALIDGLSRTHEVIAEQDSLLLWIPADALHDLLNTQPQYWRDLALLVTYKIRIMMQHLEETTVSSVETRLISRLVFMAQSVTPHAGQPTRLQLSQEQLADLLAVSRQTTNQCLKQFEQKGWIRLGYRCIDLLDLEALKAAAPR